MALRACLVAVAAVALAATGWSDGGASALLVAASAHRPAGVKETCATRSEAQFPGAFSRRANLVVGPLAMMGAAAFTPPDVVHKFEGNKFPLLVRSGHRATVELTRATRRRAALAYGPQPQHQIHLRDGHRVMTFVACRPNQESGSSADGAPVTFWSGFILARTAQCVLLRVWVDREPTARKAAVPLGRHCR